mmetsp:Transcript_33527/g.77299  ORF Transcript_33527/g.77299 Transcript_33527/m.77299 type:complete len:403 (-) Transcript_33527:344-1552(-)
MSSAGESGKRENESVDAIKFDWSAPLEPISGDECTTDENELNSERQVDRPFDQIGCLPSDTQRKEGAKAEKNDRLQSENQPHHKETKSSPLPDNSRKRLLVVTTSSDLTEQPLSFITPFRKKKTKSLPKRPMTAYGIFLQQERANSKRKSEGGTTDEISHDSGVDMEDMGNLSNAKADFVDTKADIKWQGLQESERKIFQELADRENERYRKETDERHKKGETTTEVPAPVPAVPAQPQSPLGTGSSRAAYRSTSAQASHFSPYSSRPPATHPPPPPPSAYTHPVLTQYPNPYVPSTYRPDSHINRGTSGSTRNSSDWNIHDYFPPLPSPGVHFGRPNGPPLPPWTEITLPDENGRPKRYTVQYAVYRMSREEAAKYMDGVSLPRPTTDANTCSQESEKRRA